MRVNVNIIKTKIIKISKSTSALKIELFLCLLGEGKSTKTKSMSAFSMFGNRAASFARDRMPSSGLQSILHELTTDIIPPHDEIYNPFTPVDMTPVVSPTEGPPTDKMFIQTQRGFRSVSDNCFLKPMTQDHLECGR